MSGISAIDIFSFRNATDANSSRTCTLSTPPAASIPSARSALARRGKQIENGFQYVGVDESIRAFHRSLKR